jgi:DNA-binding SARP family transcriptional activator
VDERPARGPAPCPPDERLGGVEVLLLGPVQIAGAAESLEGRPILKELVAYLSLHPEGATGDACAAVLWPDRRVPSQTLSNRLHEARRALGRDEAGSARLIRYGGRHILSCDVSTDWSRFVETTGKRSGPDDWRRALTLVRGRPFGTLTKGDWATIEGFSSLIEDRVVEVASRLATHLLHDGDHDGATWAVRRGLVVAPWDERLYRLLMVACDAAGNRGGVEAALRSLATALEWTGRPVDGVHPETAALYRRLTGAPGF